MWTPNQDAQGSASPDGVERAVPDQDQAVMAAARRTNWRTTMVSPRPCASSGRGRRFKSLILKARCRVSSPAAGGGSGSRQSRETEGAACEARGSHHAAPKTKTPRTRKMRGVCLACAPGLFERPLLDLASPYLILIVAVPCALVTSNESPDFLPVGYATHSSAGEKFDEVHSLSPSMRHLPVT